MGRNIIGFAGRLRSGKSTLADICVKYGYKKLYFALPLKQMCATYLKTSIDELNTLKNNNTSIDITFNDNDVNFFSKETEIPVEIVNKIINRKHVDNVRDLLQVIGTDLIRSYNMNWHIDRLKSMINPNESYVFDDVRFPNEKEMIEELGGNCWFIIRPNKIDNISHHISEESLTWKDFGDQVIINDKAVDYIKFVWESFIASYSTSLEVREKLILDLTLKNKTIITDDYPFSLWSYLFITHWFFQYKNCDFHTEIIKQITINKDGLVFIEYTDDTYMILENPFNIEDLKFFIQKDFIK